MLTPGQVDQLLKDAKRNPPTTRVSHADGKVEGLSLRVTDRGSASWSVEYQRPASSRELSDPKVSRARSTLGDAREIGLAKAREMAMDIRAAAREGKDPHYDKIRAKKRAEQAAVDAEAAAQQAKAGTVADLSRQWLESREAKSWRPASRSSFESHLRKWIIPSIGKVEAGAVTKADVRALLDRVHDETKIGSNRVFETMRAMWNWARGRDLVAASPCDGIKKVEKERKRKRTYTDEELRAIARVVKGTDLADLTMLVMRTATRSHETRAMRWDTVDRDRKIWTIPPEDAKADEQHEVPLNAGAWAIVSRRFKERGDSPFVFPGGTGPCPVCKARGHMGVPLNRKLRELSIDAGLLRNVGTDDAPKFEKGRGLRLHDIRRTIGDRLLNVLRVPPHVVDMGVMGHAPSGLVAVYMPSGVGLGEKQEALAVWGVYIDGILAGKKNRASVTAISSRRRA